MVLCQGRRSEFWRSLCRPLVRLPPRLGGLGVDHSGGDDGWPRTCGINAGAVADRPAVRGFSGLLACTGSSQSVVFRNPWESRGRLVPLPSKLSLDLHARSGDGCDQQEPSDQRSTCGDRSRGDSGYRLSRDQVRRTALPGGRVCASDSPRARGCVLCATAKR